MSLCLTASLAHYKSINWLTWFAGKEILHSGGAQLGQGGCLTTTVVTANACCLTITVVTTTTHSLFLTVASLRRREDPCKHPRTALDDPCRPHDGATYHGMGYSPCADQTSPGRRCMGSTCSCRRTVHVPATKHRQNNRADLSCGWLANSVLGGCSDYAVTWATGVSRVVPRAGALHCCCLTSVHFCLHHIAQLFDWELPLSLHAALLFHPYTITAAVSHCPASMLKYHLTLPLALPSDTALLAPAKIHTASV